ncbi:MFS general substrate transporter [Artomyces pyxidatus]|uniref:MFS general substrate transporter n=1 Tax=Artomyces pyxidatus TaxID=48021 RepID=A0ACB8ST15_9AGAM|nr:MFS general substrate transporter [Artomyces pyxidatus]
MGPFSDTSDEKYDRGVSVDVKEVDTGAQLARVSVILDDVERLRIRRKIDRHLLPLMCSTSRVQSMDKTTLAYAAILGLETSTHLTTDQYTWLSGRLGMVFFLSYLLLQYPQNLALQRFPVGKWMSLNIFVWSVALCCHAACTNFAGLFVCRLILGMCEGAITTGFMIVCSMFYTRNEQIVRVGYWLADDSTAIIVTALLSFGTLHIHTKGFEPWKWLMIITGFFTLLTAIAFFFLFPDSPTSAWFLTADERAKAVQRIKENQTGVENKRFKKEQMIEAIMDPKTWLFALFSALYNVPSSVQNQFQIILASFGFNDLQTTLLSCVTGVLAIVVIITGVHIASRFPGSIAWVGIAYLLPDLLAVFLANLLPWSDRVGLLCAIWLTAFGGASFVLSLAWVSQTTAGHTKRVVTNAIMLSAFCIGNATGFFMWQAKYKPRNHVPWIVTGVCHVSCIGLFLAIRVLLKARNKARDAEPRDVSYESMYIVNLDDDGKRVEVKVDKEFLDLTDKQNRDFRYVL